MCVWNLEWSRIHSIMQSFQETCVALAYLAQLQYNFLVCQNNSTEKSVKKLGYIRCKSMGISVPICKI